MIQKWFEAVPEIILMLINKGCYGREISERLDIPLTTVQRILLGLEKRNILEIQIVGRNKIYTISNMVKSKRYIFDAENYKLNKLIENYSYFQPIIEKLSLFDDEIIIIFGSYARFKADRKSDIDIFIESVKSKDSIEEIDLRINIKAGKLNKKDLLVKEIIGNHVIVKGVEKFYERIGFFKKD